MDNLQDIQVKLVSDASAVINAGKQILTRSFEECPPWMQGDPLIRRGYRKAQDSFMECFRSLFYLHNESVNTWSHLLAGACFLVLVFNSQYAIPAGIEVSAADKNMILLYNLGTVGCLFFSVSHDLPDVKLPVFAWVVE